MRGFSRKHKLLWFLTFALLGLLIAPFVGVQIQERIFRHRAEQLLADMRSLMMHKGKADDMRAMFDRWKPYNSGGSGQNFWFHKDLEYGYFSAMHQLDNMDESNRWLRLFRFLGGRPAAVHAHAETLVDGPVMSFGLETEITSVHFPPETIEQNILRAEASVVQHFDMMDAWYGLTLHPNYMVHVRSPRPGNMRYNTVSAAFGPSADPEDIRRLTRFDLSCITRLVPCRNPGDPMPEAAAQFTKEEPQLARARTEHVCDPEVIRALARNAEYVGVVLVVNVDAADDVDERVFPYLRIIRNLTSWGDWKTGGGVTLSLVDLNYHPSTARLPHTVQPGNRFIVLASTEWSHELLFVERCGIVPLTPTNLDLVRNSIAGSLSPAAP